MFDFGILFPSILNGLTTGAVYALVALGLTLIYGVLHIINFAHGAALMAALYGVYGLKTAWGIDPYLALRKKVEGMRDQFYTYEVFLNYQCVYLLADAIERAKSAKREDIINALSSSTWDKHFMPYGPTKFVNGQNLGAAPLTLQVLKNDIKVILPNTFAEAEPVFPARA